MCTHYSYSYSYSYSYLYLSAPFFYPLYSYSLFSSLLSLPSLLIRSIRTYIHTPLFLLPLLLLPLFLLSTTLPSICTHNMYTFFSKIFSQKIQTTYRKSPKRNYFNISIFTIFLQRKIRKSRINMQSLKKYSRKHMSFQINQLMLVFMLVTRLLFLQKMEMVFILMFYLYRKPKRISRLIKSITLLQQVKLLKKGLMKRHLYGKKKEKRKNLTILVGIGLNIHIQMVQQMRMILKML